MNCREGGGTDAALPVVFSGSYRVAQARESLRHALCEGAAYDVENTPLPMRRLIETTTLAPEPPESVPVNR